MGRLGCLGRAFEELGHEGDVLAGLLSGVLATRGVFPQVQAVGARPADPVRIFGCGLATKPARGLLGHHRAPGGVVRPADPVRIFG